MGTAINILCQTGLSRRLNFLTSGHSDAQPCASECPDIKNYKWRLNPIWHRVLYSYTHGNSGRQRVKLVDMRLAVLPVVSCDCRWERWAWFAGSRRSCWTARWIWPSGFSRW